MSKDIKTKNEKTRFKEGAIFSYLTLGLNSVLGIFFTPYIIRRLGESEYGLYQLIGAFVGYLSILDMGMSSAVTKYVAKYINKKDKKRESNFLFYMLIYYTLISVIVIIVGTIMYINIGNVFSNSLTRAEIEKAKKMFILLVINLIVTLYGGIFRGVMNAYKCFLETKGAEFLRVIVRVILIFGILGMGSDSIGLVMVDTLLNILFGCYRIWYCQKKIHTNFTYDKVDVNELKEVLFFSFFVFLNLLFDQINWKVDHTILGIKLNTVAVAVYSVGMNYSNYFMNFSIAVKSLFLPKVMQLESEEADGKRYTDFMVKTGRMQGYLLLYLYIAFFVLGRYFIEIIMKKDYGDAWIAALLVMSGMLVPLLQNAGHPILQAKNKHHIYVMVCLCVSVVNSVLTWFSVDKYGIIGAAFMTMGSFFVGQGVFLTWYYQKKVGIDMKCFFKNIFYANVIPALGPGIILAVIVRFWEPTEWSIFIVQGVLYTLMYWGSVYFMGMNSWEKDFLFGAVKMKRITKK